MKTVFFAQKNLFCAQLAQSRLVALKMRLGLNWLKTCQDVNPPHMQHAVKLFAKALLRQNASHAAKSWQGMWSNHMLLQAARTGNINHLPSWAVTKALGMRG